MPSALHTWDWVLLSLFCNVYSGKVYFPSKKIEAGPCFLVTWNKWDLTVEGWWHSPHPNTLETPPRCCWSPWPFTGRPTSFVNPLVTSKSDKASCSKAQCSRGLNTWIPTSNGWSPQDWFSSARVLPQLQMGNLLYLPYSWQRDL